MPATDATLTMAPWRRCAIRTPTLRATMKVPRRSILTSRSHCSIRTFSSLCILPKTPAKIAARAHQHLDDGFEFLVAVIVDRAGLPCPLQDAHIGRRNVVEMLLVAVRRKEFGFVEDAQEFRNLADEIEEGAEAFDFLPRGVRRAGAVANEAHHVDADFRQ